MLTQDFILNHISDGGVHIEMLEDSHFDPGLFRPYMGEDNRKYVIVNTGRTQFNKQKKIREPIFEKVRVSDLIDTGIDLPVYNATSLRKEEWITYDQALLEAARFQTAAWADLVSSSSISVDGMATDIFEYEAASDPGEAIVDMDGITDVRGDTQSYKLRAIPLPVTHSGFFLPARRLAASRRKGQGLDTTQIEACTRRVVETIEKTTIGTNTGLTYGGINAMAYDGSSTVFGYTNFTPRLTYTQVTAPTAMGWTPADTLNEVLAMLDLLKANKFTGQYMLYTSNDWDKYMDNDYILTGGNVATQTLRNRLRAIQEITDVRRLDFLFASAPTYQSHADDYDNLHPFTLLLVQMNQKTGRAINGLSPTVIQYQTMGGMKLHFQVMAIQVPQLRSDYYGNCGICEGTTS